MTTTTTMRRTTTRTMATTMLLPWGGEQLATQRGEIRGRGRGGERRPNYTRYRPTSKEPTVPLLSEPSPPNGRPENNAPLPRIPQSPGSKPDYAFDTLPSLVPLSSTSSLSLLSLTLREYPLTLFDHPGSLAVAELALLASIIVTLSDYTRWMWGRFRASYARRVAADIGFGCLSSRSGETRPFSTVNLNNVQLYIPHKERIVFLLV